MKRVFLIDAMSHIYRAYFAPMGARQDPLRNSKGQVTQAIFVFTNMLRKLISDEKPTNKNPINFYIFKTIAKANDTTKFIVRERTEGSDTIYVRNIDRTVAQNWFSMNYVDNKTRAALEEYLSLGMKIRDSQHVIQGHQSALNDILTNQARLRSNLGSLGYNDDQSKSLRQSYLNDLQKDEATIKQIRADIQKEEKTQRALEKQGEHLLHGMACVQEVAVPTVAGVAGGGAADTAPGRASPSDSKHGT